ncbi:MAG: zf-HC2 domain-containing protein [Gammaproteobacteria bacterium]
MLTCEQASRLLSERLDRPLRIGERLALGTHVLMCTACRQFSRQMEALRKAARRYGAGRTADESGGGGGSDSDPRAP